MREKQSIPDDHDSMYTYVSFQSYLGVLAEEIRENSGDNPTILVLFHTTGDGEGLPRAGLKEEGGEKG